MSFGLRCLLTSAPRGFGHRLRSAWGGAGPPGSADGHLGVRDGDVHRDRVRPRDASIDRRVRCLMSAGPFFLLAGRKERDAD